MPSVQANKDKNLFASLGFLGEWALLHDPYIQSGYSVTESAMCHRYVCTEAPNTASGDGLSHFFFLPECHFRFSYTLGEGEMHCIQTAAMWIFDSLKTLKNVNKFIKGEEMDNLNISMCVENIKWMPFRCCRHEDAYRASCNCPVTPHELLTWKQ